MEALNKHSIFNTDGNLKQLEGVMRPKKSLIHTNAVQTDRQAHGHGMHTFYENCLCYALITLRALLLESAQFTLLCESCQAKTYIRHPLNAHISSHLAHKHKLIRAFLLYCYILEHWMIFWADSEGPDRMRECASDQGLLCLYTPESTFSNATTHKYRCHDIILCHFLNFCWNWRFAGGESEKKKQTITGKA